MDGSGSIVRDDNTVSQVQEIVTGTYMAGRTVNARISTPAATRSLDVELGDNKTDAVIPSGLDGHTAQIGVKHAGAKLIRENSVTDVVVRVSDSGAYSPR
jgi:hypothetical protein